MLQGSRERPFACSGERSPLRCCSSSAMCCCTSEILCLCAERFDSVPGGCVSEPRRDSRSFAGDTTAESEGGCDSAGPRLHPAALNRSAPDRATAARTADEVRAPARGITREMTTIWQILPLLCDSEVHPVRPGYQGNPAVHWASPRPTPREKRRARGTRTDERRDQGKIET